MLSLLLTHDVALPDGNATEGTGRKTVRNKMEAIVVTSSCMLAALLLTGHLLRRKSRWLRALHLPASVIGGLVGWCFFACVEAVGAGDLADDWFAEGWGVLPGFCTNIIFSALFLGTPVPSPGVILASPRREHFIYGLIVVFGQYVTASLCTLFFGLFDPTLDPSFATVMPYGFAGGPVVAEAMRDLYAQFEYRDGYPLALLAATFGMVAGVVIGALLVNLAPLSTGLAASDAESGVEAARGGAGGAADGEAAASGGAPRAIMASNADESRALRRVKRTAAKMGSALGKLKETASASDHYKPNEWPSAGHQTVSVESMDSLVFHACLVMIVMLLGYLLRVPFVLAEEVRAACTSLSNSHPLTLNPHPHLSFETAII